MSYNMLWVLSHQSTDVSYCFSALCRPALPTPPALSDNLRFPGRCVDLRCRSQGADILVFSEYAILRFMQRATLAKYAAELPPVDDMPVLCGDTTQHEVRAGAAHAAVVVTL